LIDHTVMDFIGRFRDDTMGWDGHREISGIASHEPYAGHELAARIN